MLKYLKFYPYALLEFIEKYFWVPIPRWVYTVPVIWFCLNIVLKLTGLRNEWTLAYTAWPFMFYIYVVVLSGLIYFQRRLDDRKKKKLPWAGLGSFFVGAVTLLLALFFLNWLGVFTSR